MPFFIVRLVFIYREVLVQYLMYRRDVLGSEFL